jgi:hypothetical protein
MYPSISPLAFGTPLAELPQHNRLGGYSLVWKGEVVNRGARSFVDGRDECIK